MLPKKSDITIIGGGSAGLALAYHLAVQNCSQLSITIIESRSEYLNDRTWGFWNFDELHEDLRPIIRKKWNRWSFSHGQNTVVHHSVVHPYCTVSAGDYYQNVLSRISGLPNFTVANNCQAKDFTLQDREFVISTSLGEIQSKYVIDTRPPIPDYHIKKDSPSIPTQSSLIRETKMYQIFFGVEVELDYDFFDDSTIQLMADLTEKHNGMAFIYVLPYSSRKALVEYTTFTPQFFPPQQLMSHCIHAVKQLLNGRNFKIIYEEGAILPMGFSGVKSTQKNLLYAGIVGGSVRDSTGYAFIRTQRWAAHCAAELIKGRIPQSMSCDTPVDEYLDRVFLRVLYRNPQLSPQLFMSMARSLSADAFARFMMEKSTFSDYLRVILSMPKIPFIKQTFTATG